MTNTYFQAVNLWNELPDKLNPIRRQYIQNWRKHFEIHGTVQTEEQKLIAHHGTLPWYPKKRKCEYYTSTVLLQGSSSLLLLIGKILTKF